ncbi:HAMP domain-containing histidine kinase [Gramella sp. MT6]|uniref:sensor histidine kinase n=1 Tax=Gramella sp. MT6 TaxID=2705471 RepID=UPI001C5D1534|nr:HAMP domain-containing sensor histidine kinase [Gramella sp. MT6]QYA26708.1 HAMP domain-containing histidine kinase [Gramella sp. MT6]
MKLLNYTTRYFAIILLILLSVWAVLFYFEMLDEIYDSMDDGLENQKMLVIRRVKEDAAILEKNEFGEGYYTIKKVELENVQNLKDNYRDTLMYMHNEEDFEPVRLLESVFQQNGEYYKLKVITSMVEEDDLIEDLLYSLLWLYLGLIFSIILLNNIVLKKVWNPFYKLISELKNFNIEKDENIKVEKTSIEEFNLLNKQIQQLLQKSKDSFTGQKQFIENASHELQTPLAISINKLELYIENNELNEDELKQIAAVLNNLERLTRFNKSLLLLSKIENQQFVAEERVSINTIIENLVDDFSDFSRHKNMEVVMDLKEAIEFEMNKDLAIILFTNLIKNAIFHGESGSKIEIKTDNSIVNISNFSENKELKKEKLFTRLYKIRDKNSNGLGLAISKAIADEYNLALSYHFDEKHIFKVGFPKK